MVTVALFGGGNAIAATPPVVQQVDATIGAVQIASATVDAPVRVASPGDSAAAPAGAAAPQSTESSVGTAQAGAVSVHAPVRVLSRGDNAGAPRSTQPTGSQEAKDTAVGAQVASVTGHTPARVLSRGDDGGPSSSAAGGGSQRSEDSAGTVQVGPVTAQAPVRVLSPGDDATPSTPGRGGSSDPTGSSTQGGPKATSPVTGVSAEPVARSRGAGDADEPADDASSPGADQAGGIVESPVDTLTPALVGLPFTGLDALIAACAGIGSILGGTALRRTGGHEPCS
jgi:hypothetical protein